MRRLAILCAFVPVLLAGCGGSPIGEECKLTTGTMGFGFDDPCGTKCLELEDVICADGTSVRKAVCAGREGCDPGSCADGEMCYSFEDPFDKEFFCIPDDICGASPATAQERLDWERASRERSDAIRAKFAAKRSRRADGPTSVAPDVALEPKPVAIPALAALPPADPGGSVLVEAWGDDLALVVCLRGGIVVTGAECARDLPPGTELCQSFRASCRSSPAVPCWCSPLSG